MSAAAWALEVDREWAEQFESLHTAVSRIGFEAWKRIDEKTRVDTGRLRGNWIMSIGAPDPTVLETTDKTGAIAGARNRAVMDAYPDEGFPVIYLQNNVEYAIYRELGTINQAPDAMVSRTVAELSAYWEGIEL